MPNSVTHGLPDRASRPSGGWLAPQLASRFQDVRSTTMKLVAPLHPEDAVVQSMPEASPAKWHLAHTTWFFEAFVLKRASAPYRPYHPRYEYLWNSYYEGVGARQPRAERGLLTRPTLDEVLRYRMDIEERVLKRLQVAHFPSELAFAVELGIEHERQHQELLLTDIKHLFGSSPLRPCYRACAESPDQYIQDSESSQNSATAPVRPSQPPVPSAPLCPFGGEIVEIGDDAGSHFAFDNEGPRHRVFVEPFEIATRPVSCGEYLSFVLDGGYLRPELWLSDGYRHVVQNRWFAPLYWEPSSSAQGAAATLPGEDGLDRAPVVDEWRVFSLDGLRPMNLEEPVCHVSYYEADAYARWAGKRLPSESEWELVAKRCDLSGNFVDSGRLHPASAGARESSGLPTQLFGDVWEWTASAYLPYPGFRPWEGVVGEYNGKFMCNQIVLRGGSCASSRDHLRASYRNFFPPEARWQFSGIRLARSL